MTDVGASVAEPLDMLRRMQGDALALAGLGPVECGYRIIASGERWRLRDYANAASGPSLIIVAAPIKRPYIWDLARSVSVIRRCLDRRLRVYLLEWLAPRPGDEHAGLEDYAMRAIGEAVAHCSRERGATKPFLIGHSLGGTLAAIFASAQASSISGLVLLSSPLCFAPGCSAFRDRLVAIAPSLASGEIVPGAALSQLSALASPATFVWSRLVDAGLSLADPAALEVHVRVQRWSLDEVPLPGRLVDEILRWLYREDRFCTGTLRLGGKTVGPSSLEAPVLAAVSAADDIAPRGSVLPFLGRLPKAESRLIEYPGEIGVGFQHLAGLVGRRAHASLWPQIIDWLHAHA